MFSVTMPRSFAAMRVSCEVIAVSFAVTLPPRVLTSPLTAATFSSVAESCAKFTASLEVTPEATFFSVTISVPLPSVTLFLPASYLTAIATSALTAFIADVLPAMSVSCEATAVFSVTMPLSFAAMRVSCEVIAVSFAATLPPRMLTSPLTAATLSSVAESCAKFTASFEVTPAATFFSVTALPSLLSVTDVFASSSYLTAIATSVLTAFIADVLPAMRASCETTTPSRALSCDTFTASVSAIPAATPASWRVKLPLPIETTPIPPPFTVALTPPASAPVGT